MCGGVLQGCHSQGKLLSCFFQGQGKVREFCIRPGSVHIPIYEVNEKSGNFFLKVATDFYEIHVSCKLFLIIRCFHTHVGKEILFKLKTI